MVAAVEASKEELRHMKSNITILSEQELTREMDINGINNPTSKAGDLLTESELNCFWTLCNRCSGPLTLRKIYGEYWWSIRGPRKLGLRFSRTLDAGKLVGVRRAGKKSRTYIYDWEKSEQEPTATVAANEGTFATASLKVA